jgi:hypothetical protein
VGQLLLLDFAPKRSPQPRGAFLRPVFEVSRRESAISWGLVARDGSVVLVGVDVGLRGI